ncbi:DNA polymerase II [Amphritea pacifica]|uniref:DNA polymerase II n=1 Tax=Amphritea pacifica TaxID=2811233 RepID=UPI001964A42C|nr:DNA polymerase II [Amphritea pacifica]
MQQPSAAAGTAREGFILTRQQFDTPHGISFQFWLKSGDSVFPVTVPGQEGVFFVLEEDVPRIESLLSSHFKNQPDLHNHWRLQSLPLKDLQQRPVYGLYSHSLTIYRQLTDLLQTYAIPMIEEDIRPVDRFLMERFIQDSARVRFNDETAKLQPTELEPRLTMLSVDIETTMRADRIFSIGLYSDQLSKVLIVGDGPNEPWLEYVNDERALLQAFVREVEHCDPDIFIGWNVVGFDFRVLQERAKRLQVQLNLGRDGSRIQVIESANGKWFCRIAGRVVLDGIDTLKGATWQFESFSLEYVSNQLLDRGKLLGQQMDEGLNRGEEIQQVYRENPRQLAEYNLEDCKLVWDIFEHAQLLHYLIERSRLTGLPLDKVGGSAAAFDNQYLPRLHRKGYVAPVYASGESQMGAPGGYVMESRPGLYHQVLVLDFKSLYPSIIRTFMIDPYALAEGTGTECPPEDLVPGFNHAIFTRKEAILPGIIERLWQARDRAKAEKNAPLSQAIKIIMNSFYGVLGSNVCRFFDQRLAGSITLRGHEILTRTKAKIEQQFGYTVIYGDTDSVFVWLGDEFPVEQAASEGKRLEQFLNQWWQEEVQQRFGLPCHLELEYETHYRRFLMPTMRHSEKGTKKRYAGIRLFDDGREELVFKGLESVRSDWTPLARRVQRELYRLIFSEQPYSDYLKQIVNQLKAGELDNELVYRKRLRRPLDEYTKNRPPHVQAAQKAQDRFTREGKKRPFSAGMYIEYLMTVNGPEPRMFARSPIDYQHYLDRQLTPVADSILMFLGDSFAALYVPQIDLF